jgi:hypothetical protein
LFGKKTGRWAQKNQCVANKTNQASAILKIRNIINV